MVSQLISVSLALYGHGTGRHQERGGWVCENHARLGPKYVSCYPECHIFQLCDLEHITSSQSR